jgi:hypothetical protein
MRLALSAVLPGHRGWKTNLKIITDEPGIGNVLDGIDDETSRWFRYYKDLTVSSIALRGATVDVQTDDIIKLLKSIAQDALKTQEHYDSGTKAGLPC